MPMYSITRCWWLRYQHSNKARPVAQYGSCTVFLQINLLVYSTLTVVYCSTLAVQSGRIKLVLALLKSGPRMDLKVDYLWRFHNSVF